MAVADVVDARVNPANTNQRVILWGNGRIDVRNCPPILDGPNGWFERVDQPVAKAIHVYDWVAMKGYVLDKQGGFHAFGGANIVTIGGDNGSQVVGVPYWPDGIYVDWDWDPNNPGRGVVLDGFGTLHPFGGAPTPPRALNRWSSPAIARKLAMDWTPGNIKAYTLDYTGGIHPDYDAGAASGYPYWDGWDTARDFVVTDWSTASGYTLDFWGAVFPWAGTQAAPGGPYLPGADRARTLIVLNAGDPLRLWEVWGTGQEFEWTASTPPVVTAGGVVTVSPAATVTTSTRPALLWDYSDPQNDSQARWELYVFTQAFASSHTMTDPSVHATSALVAESGVDRTLRGITPPVDFENGQYRMYVRAQDTAGQWSEWSDRGWTQNVPVPSTPTGLTAAADDDTFSVLLSVSATAGPNADYVRFDASDDGGATWTPVVGADAVPLDATVATADRFPPLGMTRTYRAVAYSDAPRVASLPSATATATVTSRTYTLHAVGDAALGGEIDATSPFGWSRPVVAGVFDGLGAEYPLVVSGGTPKARRLTLELNTMDAAEWAKIEDLVRSDDTLVFRDPFGEVVYCRVVGDWKATLMEAVSEYGEQTALAHAHRVTLPLVEVQPPTEGS